MEAAKTLTKKKSFSKGKLKKTIKNVLFRPDPVKWPLLPDNQDKAITDVLQRYKIEIPEYKKPHWDEIKSIPKDKRPKAPKLEKVNGLIFGISHCSQSLQKGQCGAVILDADIQPRLLVQHIIDSSNAANIPCICLKDLKQNSLKCFGFKSCCIGVTDNDNVSELLTKIIEVTKTSQISNVGIPSPLNVEKLKDTEKMQVEPHKENSLVENDKPPFSYLYRTSTLSRVFEPPTANPSENKTDNKFTSQNFIGMNKPKINKSKGKSFKNMIVKQVTNNPNRKRKNK